MGVFRKLEDEYTLRIDKVLF